MDHKELRYRRRILHEINKEHGPNFVPVPKSSWPANFSKLMAIPDAVYQSNQFLVQVFHEPNHITRLSVARTEIQNNGMWKDGISWDELQSIKDRLGYHLFDAVEVFPARDDIVCVANMRHLFVLPELLPFAWRKVEKP